jgi:predicted Rossmann fold flavoprotein
MERRIVVVGGGAAGMMAAGRAAEVLRREGDDAEVLLLEKMPRPGTKLRITGKGRCNITNACEIREFLDHLGPNGIFLRNAAARFFVEDTVRFFHAHGVPTTTERGRRVFPISNDANDVAEALRRYCVDHDVILRLGARVVGLEPLDGQGWRIMLTDEELTAQAVILATGGLSYPGTGSTGDGYGMAHALGHTVTPLRPGLVPLVTAEEFVPRLQGLSLRHVRATLTQQGRELGSEFGEMLFTHYGVSGPIILTLSSRLGDALQAGPIELCIDLKPALARETLDLRLLRELRTLGRAHYQRLLKTLLPASLIDVFAERSGISLQASLGQFTAEQRGRVIELLKCFRLTVVGTRPIAEAIITLGGVACDELVPQTMASRLHHGLYMVGELLDVAGDTGGYNLQIAFTTGHVAGESAAQALLKNGG